MDSSTRTEHHSENTPSVFVATVPEDSSELGEHEQQHADKKKGKGTRRPVGRPRGSGPKQQAVWESEANGMSTSPPNKRPVGRLRKVVTHGLRASKQAISGSVSIYSRL